jgi:hypothetical protein
VGRGSFYATQKVLKKMSIGRKKLKEGTKLYFGTSERLAKLSPVTGLLPGRIEAGSSERGKHPKPNSRSQRLYLTSVYSAYFAFCNTQPGERWGIVEIDAAALDPDLFLPDEDYLAERPFNGVKRKNSQPKLRANQLRAHLAEYRPEWRDCLERFGTCVYEAPIPHTSITKVSIYDPVSNGYITAQVIYTTISIAGYQSTCFRNRSITRWLMGDNISCQDWLAGSFDATSIEDRDKVIDALQETSGLDIFYFGPAPKKVSPPRWMKTSK